MRLLRLLDYERCIQSDNLGQILESNYTILADTEQAAQAEMISYLAQRYVTTDIFRDTKVFNINAVYFAKQLVEYTEAQFSATTVYTINQRVSQSGFIYKSIAGSTSHAFNIVEWTLICADKLLYYVSLPYSEYSTAINYTVGTQIWYNNIVYTALQPNTNVNPTNTYFWSAGATYTVSGVYPDDITKYTQGDNRNQQIVMYLMDMTLFHLHRRINPRNIPDLRKEAYNGNDPKDGGGALGWLNKVAKGMINADLPEIALNEGLSISWGNASGINIRSINSY